MSRSFRARIVGNTPVHVYHNLLSLSVPGDTPEPLPGQFYMIGVRNGTDPLLKRAFSLFRRSDNSLQILYRVRGRGTAILAGMKEGSEVEVLGPLGSSYPLPPEDAVPLVIAGGIGIASVYPVVERMAGRAVLFYGARTDRDLLMRAEVEQLTRRTLICTDDGSAGERGSVADGLQRFLDTERESGARYCIYACGPHPLLRIIAGMAAQHKIPAYVSMEEHMACGIGACLGCVVRAIDGYRRVCKEGPVFPSKEIIW